MLSRSLQLHYALILKVYIQNCYHSPCFTVYDTLGEGEPIESVYIAFWGQLTNDVSQC